MNFEKFDIEILTDQIQVMNFRFCNLSFIRSKFLKICTQAQYQPIEFIYSSSILMPKEVLFSLTAL